MASSRRAARATGAAPVAAAKGARRTRMTLHDFDLFKGHIRWRDNVPVYVYEYPAGKVFEGADAVAYVHDLNERWLARNPNK